MVTSLITKKKIAKAFKKLLAQKRFDKISVVDIMTQAQIRRQTFYNHFLDKYELVDWIFETELQEHITHNLNYISGFQLLEEVFFYFEQNQTFYAHLLAYNGQNDFYSYLEPYCTIVVEKIIHESLTTPPVSKDAEYLAFITQYHAHALADMLRRCVMQHAFPTSITPMKRLFISSIQ